MKFMQILKNEKKKITKPEDLEELNEDEFEKAMSYLSNKTGFMSLEALGILKELLIFGVMVLAVYFMLKICFYFPWNLSICLGW